MKNFDTGRSARKRTEEERTFLIAGETFVLRAAIRPEVLSIFDGITDDSKVGDTMKAWDDLFRELVENRDGAYERYERIRTDPDDPLTLDDLQEMVEWMMEQVTGRPTGSPSGSTPEPEGTGTSSTEDSSSQALRVA